MLLEVDSWRWNLCSLSCRWINCILSEELILKSANNNNNNVLEDSHSLCSTERIYLNLRFSLYFWRFSGVFFPHLMSNKRKRKTALGSFFLGGFPFLPWNLYCKLSLFPYNCNESNTISISIPFATICIFNWHFTMLHFIPDHQIYIAFYIYTYDT